MIEKGFARDWGQSLSNQTERTSSGDGRRLIGRITSFNFKDSHQRRGEKVKRKRKNHKGNTRQSIG